ncbi:MAG: UDP-glucose dehydrogenase family protein [Chloroflexota bacterium]
MATISIIGSGYVGLVYAAAFADLGNDVWGVDIDESRVKQLNAGECPIFEPGLPELIKRGMATGRLRFTTNYAEAVPCSQFVFVCVDTPSTHGGEADMRPVRRAASMLANHLTDRAIVVNKSTMPIGSGDLVAQIIADNAREGLEFAVVSNPEFLREGSAVQDVLNPDRIILGADGDQAAAREVEDLYRALNAPVVITDRRSAEMIKYASNSFLATRISFINEIAMICERLGADVTVVAKGMGYDDRIGPLFLSAGVGFGGSCFPKDVRALAHMAHEADTHPQLLHAVLEINADQRRRFVRRLQDLLGDLESQRIAVWGLAFKQDTDDMREAPAIDIIQTVQQRGATVVAYDPAANRNAKAIIPNLETVDSPYDAVRGADALCIVTPWNEFKQANLSRVAELMRKPIILDGRNLYDPADVSELGITYASIGRQLLRPNLGQRGGRSSRSWHRRD